MRPLVAALAGLALSLAAVQAMAAPAPAGKPSVETTPIGELVANDKTKAVLAKDMPGLLTYEGLDQIKGMTLRDISKFPEANLDDAKLAAMQKDFDTIP